MSPDEITSLIGRPYALGADGPECFDCRGLLLYCQRRFFGKTLPILPMGLAMREVYAEQVQAGHWQSVAMPEHGDAVLLRGGDHPHVGLWLTCIGPGVLHALEGVGVVWSPATTLRLMGYSRLRFVRFHTGFDDSADKGV